MNLTLNSQDFAALSPLLILLAGALILLLIESFAEKMSKKYAGLIAFAFILATLFAVLQAPAGNNPLLTPWIKSDHLTRVFSTIFMIIGLSVVLLSSSFLNRFDATKGEYYFLLLAALFGLILIASSADFLTLFLGIETLSIALYVWCGYMKDWENSHESSMKYFIMGAMAAALLLYGIALIYGAVGTTSFAGLLENYQKLQGQDKILFLSGIALVTLGLAFEAAIVPFHIWSPDVYAGASTPVTAFMAVGTKAGAFAAFARVFLDTLPNFDMLWNEGISFLAYPTLIYANYVALRQVQLRRFFAYSGISHAGFMLIPLAAQTPDSLSALIFYLVVYVVATLGAFAVLTILDHKKQGVLLHDLHGLFKKSPYLAGLLALCLLTLAGIPPTAGFFGKFYIFKVAFQAGYYALVIVGLLTTILSAFYYLRIIGIMLSESPAEAKIPDRALTANALGALAMAGLLVLAIYPEPLISLINGSK